MGRRATFDLGATAKGSSSAEANLSSFTRAFVLITAGTGTNVQFTVEASPTAFGSDGDWYDVFHATQNSYQVATVVGVTQTSTNVGAGNSRVYSLPLPLEAASVAYELHENNAFDCLIPQRIRIKNTGASGDADFTSVMIEAHQRRA